MTRIDFDNSAWHDLDVLAEESMPGRIAEFDIVRSRRQRKFIEFSDHTGITAVDIDGAAFDLRVDLYIPERNNSRSCAIPWICSGWGG